MVKRFAYAHAAQSGTHLSGRVHEGFEGSPDDGGNVPTSRLVRMSAFELSNCATATVLEAERLHSDCLTRTLTGAGADCGHATAL